MGLRNIVIARETIVVDDAQSFDVRGITLFDMMQAVGDFGPQLALVFGKLTARDGDAPLMSTEVKSRIREIAGEFPDVLAACIAMASDDYTVASMTIAKQLPPAVQADAIEKIARLTFRSEAELGKFMGSLVQAMASAMKVAETTKFPLPTGTGDSEGS